MGQYVARDVMDQARSLSDELVRVTGPDGLLTPAGTRRVVEPALAQRRPRILGDFTLLTFTNRRGEFLTAYAGEPYDDHGRFQALFEYASMMGELLNMDVVNVPTYDGYQAAATSIRMAARITGRREVRTPDLGGTATMFIAVAASEGTAAIVLDFDGPLLDGVDPGPATVSGPLGPGSATFHT